MSARNSIQVGIKVRPLLAKEKEMAWRVDENTISLNGNQAEPYCFDYVFDQEASNQEIFDKMAKHIVHSAVHGFNGTIFAYGQTASGKTYTMMGETNDPGVMVLAAKEVFKEIENTPSSRFLLRGGFIEIYNEKIYDLLNKSNSDLKIHETANGNTHVNCEEFCITSEEQLLKLLETGNLERTVGGTNMNERSSRSHAIFRLIIESSATDSEDGNVTQSVLNLVDLAGSERADQTGASGTRLKEGGHINKSLMFLSKVIQSLSEVEDKFINYRDSKLTRILQASLGGNAFTSIICTVKPTAIEETQSTLNFAMRARKIKNKPHLNEVVSDATMMKRLAREIKDLKKQLEEERSKNVSQIKVAQIEKMLTFQEHKFLNSSSTRRENRRRTWCPDSANVIETNNAINVKSTNPLFNDMTASRIKPPKFNVHLTPLITSRDFAPENRLRAPTELAVPEEFEPAEFFDFNNFPTSPKTPTKSKTGDDFLKLSVSPVNKNTSAHLKILEEEFQSLQEFANLEKEVGVQRDVVANLELKLEALRKRNEELEREKVTYLSAQIELDLIKENLNSSEKRCDDLQIQITKLTNYKRETEEKVERYESQLSLLKKTVEDLELENRNVVSTQFVVEAQCNKAKLREKELLEVLNEKDLQIAGFEKQLKALQAEQLQNSKDKLMKLTRNSDDQQVFDTDSCNSNLCVKCEDLQIVLEENKKLTLGFEKVTLQYKELLHSYEKSKADGLYAQKQLSELKELESKVENLKEREELQNEIKTLRSRLETIEKDYKELKCDRDEKSNRCKSLSQEVEIAQKQLNMLQNRYDTLEVTWQKQEDTIVGIKADYTSLERKYNELKTTYENLEHNSTKYSSDCVRLQSENDCLQTEIQKLKTRIEDMREQLLDGWVSKDTSISVKENGGNDMQSELKAENEGLRVQLMDLQSQFKDLQQECDQLSTNVMETVQENDELMGTLKSLENKLTELESQKSLLEEARNNYALERVNFEKTIEDLQRKLEEKRTIDGVSGDDGLNDTNEPKNNKMPFLESVEHIELENDNGKKRVYIAVDSCIIKESNPAKLCKLSLTNWEKRRSSDEDGFIGELGFLKAFITYNEDFDAMRAVQEGYNRQTIQALQETIVNLETQVLSLQCKNEALFESSQRNISELREEIKRLTSELCEKSGILDDLFRERAEITQVNEELQMKLATSQSDMNLTSTSVSILMSHTVCQDLNESVHENSNQDDLSAIQTELKEKKEECIRLKLEMLEKLELAENEFRSNLKKYNGKWEEKRLSYENRIKELEKALVKQELNIKQEIDSYDPNNDDVDYERTFCDNMLETKCEYDVKNSSVHTGNMSSTPTTPPSSNVAHSERYLEIQRSRVERFQMVQECNEQISKLCSAIEEAKEINAQLSATLAEKEKLLQEKELEIETLKTSLTQTEFKGEDVTKKTMHLLKEIEKKDTEILDLKKSLDRAECRAQEQEEKFESKQNELEDKMMELKRKDEEVLKLKTMLKGTEQNLSEMQKNINERVLLKQEMEKNLEALQGQYQDIFEERDNLLKKVKELIKQNEDYNTNLTVWEKERSDLKKNLEDALSEKIALSLYLDDSKKDKLLIETNLKVLEDSQVELKAQNSELKQRLEDTLKLRENVEIELERVQKQQIENEEAIDLMKKQINVLNVLDSEHSRLQSELTMVKSNFMETEKTLLQEVASLKQKCAQCKLERDEALQKIDTINQKMETLAQDHHKAQLRLESLEKTLQEYEVMEKQLELVSKKKSELELEVTSLHTEISQMKDSLNAARFGEKEEVERLHLKLKQLEVENTALTNHQNTLRDQVKTLEEKLCNEKKILQRANDEMQSQLNELKLKNDSLEETKKHLITRNKELEQHLATAQRDSIEYGRKQNLIDKLQYEKESSEARLKLSLVEAEKRNDTLHKKLEEQEETCKNLRTLLDAEKAAYKDTKIILEGTIVTLQNENKSLMERLEVVNEIVKKRTDVCESANNSMETSTNSLSSPLAHRSPGKTVAHISSEDKKSSIQKDRKNRRLSTHDENRRQSAKFKISVDAGTITDPLINNCDCNDLREKLQECETQLYIRQSQVTALNIELRNHPLKAEKAALVKRIQEEQEKNRLETKKYKTKISEQAAKIQTLTDQVKVASSVVVAPVSKEDRGTCTSPKSTYKCVETQTQMEIDQCLQKLQGKYNDLKNICRSRYNKIASLEKIIEEKENILRVQCSTVNQTNQRVLASDKSFPKIPNERRME